ncbi:hypothetical protein [Lichenibacterium dinghuense]|uniref:hypothetical protein n=1 Tax=Lichenibacterium dinghuense TaxID=2895977 RepID=UPI001F1883FC|nr:hypothetical protein [Lichenibacterium sp. 6Y81]
MTYVELIERSIRHTDVALREDRERIENATAIIEQSRRMIADADAHLRLYETAMRPLAFACAMTAGARLG